MIRNLNGTAPGVSVIPAGISNAAASV